MCAECSRTDWVPDWAHLMQWWDVLDERLKRLERLRMRDVPRGTFRDIQKVRGAVDSFAEMMAYAETCFENGQAWAAPPASVGEVPHDYYRPFGNADGG